MGAAGLTLAVRAGAPKVLVTASHGSRRPLRAPLSSGGAKRAVTVGESAWHGVPQAQLSALKRSFASRKRSNRRPEGTGKGDALYTAATTERS